MAPDRGPLLPAQPSLRSVALPFGRFAAVRVTFRLPAPPRWVLAVRPSFRLDHDAWTAAFLDHHGRTAAVLDHDGRAAETRHARNGSAGDRNPFQAWSQWTPQNLLTGDVPTPA
jgi:hypothetical protein